MAVDDINPARRAEYEAALEPLKPQIRGLRSIGNDIDISPEAKSKIQEELSDRIRREDLLKAALTQLDACNSAHANLINDGYPDLPLGVVSDSVLKELNDRRNDVEAAMDQFETVSMEVSLGSPATKKTT